MTRSIPQMPNGQVMRHVLAQGACNFRDVGGKLTQTGQRVRMGRIFRSGVLDHLDPEDALLIGLGIRTVIDLRTSDERTARPSRLPKDWAAGVWARDYTASGGDHAGRPTARSAEDTVPVMHKVYRRMPFEQAAAYRIMFLRLAADETPLLVHCLGGKDRTGVAVALLLEILGVSRDNILWDYALSNVCLVRDRDVLEPDRVAGTAEDEAARAPLMAADPAYLDSMFDKLVKNFGGTAGYFEQALGLDADILDRVRNNLLVL